MRRTLTQSPWARRVVPGLSLALLLTAGRALAEDQAGSAGVAKLRFQQGTSAYREGRYADAIRAFSDADALAPRPALSFDIARAYERLGEPARAIDAYRDYLRRAPNAANADLVRARIAALDAAAAPPAAPVPATGPTSPKNARSDAAAGHPDDGVAARASFAPWSWVALGTGGALLVGAGVAELMRRGAESDTHHAPTQLAYVDDYRRMHDEQTVARVLFGVGGALAVAGGALLAVDFGRGRRAEARVSCLPSGCLGALEGSF